LTRADQDYQAVGSSLGIFASTLSKATIDQSMFYTTATVQSLQNMRHLYVPLDPTFEAFFPINNTKFQTFGGDNFWFVGYATGLGTTPVPFVFDVYANYELEPDGGSFLENFAVATNEKGTAQAKIEKIDLSTDLLANVSSDVMKDVSKVDETFLSSGNLTSIANSALKIATEHSGILMGLGAMMS